MCGISGFFSPRADVSVDAFIAGFDTLRHRGPDDEGLFVVSDTSEKIECHTDRTVHRAPGSTHIRSFRRVTGILGHHRLSILDLSSAGHQPFRYQHLVLTFNGEIYNYVELRAQLETKGYTFSTGTDTEVVIKAFHLYGTKSFSLFNGMWALAIYDLRRSVLCFSRDRFGIKPLYFSNDRHDLLFASELKFFFTLGYRSVRQSSARDYLLNMHTDHDRESFVDSVEQLPPATFGEYSVKTGHLSLSRYWALDRGCKLSLREVSPTEASRGVERLFASAVDLRLRSDVGVGALLSGGVDSTATMGQMLRNTKAASTLHSYSAVFSDETYSERRDIERTLQKWEGRVRQTFVQYDEHDVIRHLNALIWHQDIPFRSLAVLSQFLIYKRIAESDVVKVLLNGQGADEIFGGYTNHQFASIVGKIMRLQFFRAFTEMHSVQRSRGFDGRYMASSMLGVAKLGIKSATNGDVAALFYPLTLLLLTNLRKSALPEYLRYEDRNSMAFSRESRLPFLDYRLVEFAWALPEEYKVRRGVTKWIQREALRDVLPAHIYKGRIKRGFISPQERWQKIQPLAGWVSERQKRPDIFSAKEWAALRYGQINNPWFQWRVALFNEWRAIQGLRSV